MPSTTPTLSRPSRKSHALAVSSPRSPKQDPNQLVSFTTTIPLYVRQHLERAAGLASGAAMGRKVLTDWSEANKASR